MDEQTIIRTLRNLPVAVVVTPLRTGGYAWQCLDGSGWAADLPGAIDAGLCYLIVHVAGDAGALDNLKSKQK